MDPVPKITDLQFLPEDRLRVVFDGKLDDQIVPSDFVLMLGLQVGTKVSPKVLTKLAFASSVMEAKKEGQLICQNSDKNITRSSLRKMLEQRGYLPESVDQAIADLEKSGYIKGAVFAQKWVDRRQKSSPRSKRLIQHELRAKGVDNPDIEQVLSQFSENEEIESAWLVYQKYAKRYQSLTPHVARRRLHGLLMRRGFSHSTIQSVEARFETEVF